MHDLCTESGAVDILATLNHSHKFSVLVELIKTQLVTHQKIKV